MQPERRRLLRSLGAVTAAVPVILAGAPLQGVAAQQNGLVRDSLTALGPRTGVFPFLPGEELKFRVNASIFGGGEAVMKIGRPEAIHGFSTLPLEFTIQGRLGGGAHKLDDKYYSWIDPEELISRRFHKITDHGRRIREYEFFPDDLRVQRIDHDTAWAMPSPQPLDDLSFVFFARTLPLEVGDTYTYNRYFKEAGNPVIIEVLRRDQVETEAGVFNTIVVRPIIPGSNLFEQGARAEIHFSDDERRLVVYMKLTKFWIVPLSMELTEYTMGVPAEPGEVPGPAQRREDEQPVEERPATPDVIAIGGKAAGRR
ncbi:MAG: DUF3108 domain-containing protein [Gemmatimonadota bacterium]|nr:DUF3108 domain-containing protein [Gemmatimonadota bacterium]MXX35920.1 DUF3108 domain-containing protein [Gemmatimonadota bacterium]MYD13326.1 DUF3108 domain-containing protein [Gemmatimonadota bacterium]